MFKLMKYEIRKQAVSKVIILSITALLQLLFLVGVGTDNDDLTGLGVGWLIFFSFCAIVYLGFEVINTYSKDLKEKQSYMLFLTPHSPYTILGAKLISAFFQLVIAVLIFFMLLVFNTSVVLSKYEIVSEIVEIISMILKEFEVIEVDYLILGIVLASAIVKWLVFVVTAMCAITLSTTFLANNKLKGILSFVLFLIINGAITYISGMMFTFSINMTFEQANLLQIIVGFVFTAILYFITGFMLDKKVSV